MSGAGSPEAFVQRRRRFSQSSKEVPQALVEALPWHFCSYFLAPGFVPFAHCVASANPLRLELFLG